MRYLLGLLLIYCSLLVSGCALKVPAVTEALPITKVPALNANSKSSQVVGTQTRYFSGSNSLPPLAKALQIDTMAFRSVLTDPADQAADALKDDARIDQCPEGRPNLDFIQSVVVGVRHKSEKDEDAVLVASYVQAQKGLCGFHLTPTYFDMKDYASDYTFVIRVTGTAPSAPVTMSGYYTAQDYEGI